VRTAALTGAIADTGSSSEEALNLLASWTATPERTCRRCRRCTYRAGISTTVLRPLWSAKSPPNERLRKSSGSRRSPNILLGPRRAPLSGALQSRPHRFDSGRRLYTEGSRSSSQLTRAAGSRAVGRLDRDRAMPAPSSQPHRLEFLSVPDCRGSFAGIFGLRSGWRRARLTGLVVGSTLSPEFAQFDWRL
jgi:hypothetical protein